MPQFFASYIVNESPQGAVINFKVGLEELILRGVVMHGIGKLTGSERGERSGGAAAALVRVVAQVVEWRRVGVAVGAPLVLLDEHAHVGLARQRDAHAHTRGDAHAHTHRTNSQAQTHYRI